MRQRKVIAISNKITITNAPYNFRLKSFFAMPDGQSDAFYSFKNPIQDAWRVYNRSKI